jgi:hypothetical protein
MSGEIDAVGTAVEGALLGASVDGANIGTAAASADGKCLNCGTALSGRYCAACGQKAEIHRTLSAIWHDILHSVLHFDGKLWRTLPMLLFRPGELTRRYIDGERAKFVSPMALFLFSIFLMFAVFSFGGTTNFNNAWQKDIAASAEKIDTEIGQIEAKLKAIPPPAPTVADALKKRLESLKSDRNGIAFATNGAPIYDDAGARVSAGGPVSINYSKSDTGIGSLDRILNEGGQKMVRNPGLALYKLQSNGYKFAWLLIPLSLPFVWIVTLGAKKHRFYDHAVFTTYSIAFMSLLFLLAALLNNLGITNDFKGLILVFVPAVHLYKQLRHTYDFSRLGTVLRMFPLLISIIMVMVIFFALLLFFGFLG